MPVQGLLSSGRYLWLDATYVKVREAGRIVPVAVTVAVAVNDQGRREILGMAIGASEAETVVRRGDLTPIGAVTH